MTAGTALSRRGALAGTAHARATHSATRRSRSRSGTGTTAPADDSVTERNTLLRDEGGLIADAVMWPDAPLGAMKPRDNETVRSDHGLDCPLLRPQLGSKPAGRSAPRHRPWPGPRCPAR